MDKVIVAPYSSSSDPNLFAPPLPITRASTTGIFEKYVFAVTCASIQTWTVLHTVCSRISTCHR